MTGDEAEGGGTEMVAPSDEDDEETTEIVSRQIGTTRP